MIGKGKVKVKKKKKPKVIRRPLECRYNPTKAVQLYAALRDGLSIRKALDLVGASTHTLARWRKKYPEVEYAVTEGLKFGEKNRTENLRDFIIGRLPEDLRAVYEELEQLDDTPNPGRTLDMIMEDRGVRQRQQLFLYALFSCNFNPSAARRMVGVTKLEYEKWRDHDLDFMRLVEEVMVAKKDFVEGKLMELVRLNDAGAVIFANKTLNRDRGYDPRLTVEHKGQVTHVHASLEKVFDRLSIDTQREVVAALEAYRDEKAPRVVKVIEEEITRGS